MMFELVFHNGRQFQYRKSEFFDKSMDELCRLLIQCGLQFGLYLNCKRIEYPVDLNKICKYVV